MSGKLSIHIGLKFGRLTIVREAKPDGYKRKFLCKCDCGNTLMVNLSSLRSGNTKSCGCLRSETIIAKNKGRKGYKNIKYIKKNIKYWDLKDI